jgi:hypothetical protein
MFVGKVLPARKADNLSAICEPTSRTCALLDVSRPVTGIALLFYIPASVNVGQQYWRPSLNTCSCFEHICRVDALDSLNVERCESLLEQNLQKQMKFTLLQDAYNETPRFYRIITK